MTWKTSKQQKMCKNLTVSSLKDQQNLKTPSSSGQVNKGRAHKLLTTGTKVEL